MQNPPERWQKGKISACSANLPNWKKRAAMQKKKSMKVNTVAS